MADEFEIREVRTLDEYRQVNDVMWEAAHNPYKHVITGYTEEDYQRSKEEDAVKLWAQAQANPASRWIMAVEKSTGRVVGGTQWLFFHKNPFPDGPPVIPCTWYPEGSDYAEYASRICTSLARPRGMWCQRAHAGVNSTGVLTAYRRRGIGVKLIEWGLKIVDELGYDCFIEASDLGRQLYERAGFRTMMVTLADMSKPNPSPTWKRLMHEWAPHKISLLWRPPYGAWTETTPLGPWDYKVPDKTSESLPDDDANGKAV